MAGMKVGPPVMSPAILGAKFNHFKFLEKSMKMMDDLRISDIVFTKRGATVD